MNLLHLLSRVAVLALAVCAATPVHAQWLTQTITLKPGWNAVYLHVDASHDTLDNLVRAVSGNPIKEIWLWQPAVSTVQFTTTPQQPTTPNSQWAVWDSSPVVADTLTRLVGNAAYLVNNTNTGNYVWTIKGKPVPPRYQWTTSGLNFIGFPTPAATSSTLNFDAFLGPVPAFQNAAEIYRYPGGALGASNPTRVFPPLFRGTFVKRGEAFWIRSGATYNRYYAPVEINLQNAKGIGFADNLGASSIRLKNVTTSSRTVTISLLASEPVPLTTPAQVAIVGVPPMLVRGTLNLTNLTYDSAPLSPGAGMNYTLAPQGQPGSELEVVVGVNRALMTQPAGSLYAGIMRFTDDAGLEQVDVPVTATVGSTAGLWVGSASVTSVNHYLKSYAATNAPATLPPVDPAGYMVTSLPGYVWNALPPTAGQNWQALAVSANGAKQVGVANGGLIYTSQDAGVTWVGVTNVGVQAWSGVASSADGTKLVAVVNGGRIYTSANSGATWTARESSRSWVSVASSADGVKLAAVVNGGQIFTSVNSGATWAANAASQSWTSISSSADGVNLVAAVDGGLIYTSVDSGATWTFNATSPTASWRSLASSDNGVRLVAAANNLGLFTSKDSGATWTSALALARAWTSVATSADGLKLVACERGGNVWTSSDAGVNWVQRDTTRNWQAVASSADGALLLAAENSGSIYLTTGAFTQIEVDASGRVIARTGADAPYLSTATNSNPGSVGRAYPLRLILHNDNVANSANLLQRVYFGQRFSTNFVVATQESLLDQTTLDTARRISATHLPFSHTNLFWPNTGGAFALGGNLVFNVNLDYKDHASNPFLHRYHPDHDNLGTDFKTVQVQGAESYTVNRQISLTFTAPGGDFASLTSTSDRMGGNYSEVITLYGTGSNTRQFNLSGTFSLNRLSSIPTLTTK